MALVKPSKLEIDGFGETTFSFNQNRTVQIARLSLIRLGLIQTMHLSWERLADVGLRLLFFFFGGGGGEVGGYIKNSLNFFLSNDSVLAGEDMRVRWVLDSE